MSSNIPFVKVENSLLAIVIKLSFYLLLCLLFYFVDKKAFFVEAAFLYGMLSYSLQTLIPTEHRKGINLIKQEKYDEAIPHFQKSVDFFTKYAWVDKYRALTLFISSKKTFREISLCNMAYCYLQSNRAATAKKIYENVLVEYPENVIAKSQLRTINSASFGNQQI